MITEFYDPDFDECRELAVRARHEAERNYKSHLRGLFANLACKYRNIVWESYYFPGQTEDGRFDSGIDVFALATKSLGQDHFDPKPWIMILGPVNDKCNTQGRVIPYLSHEMGYNDNLISILGIMLYVMPAGQTKIFTDSFSFGCDCALQTRTDSQIKHGTDRGFEANPDPRWAEIRYSCRTRSATVNSINIDRDNYCSSRCCAGKTITDEITRRI